MNPLTDILPARARKYVYAVVALTALLFGAWQAADGNWAVFGGSVLGGLVSATAASNTNAPPADPTL
jgi:hypothetical protein